MRIAQIDPGKMEFSEEELDGMIDCLDKAEQIKKDQTLMQILQKRMKSKVKSIKSLSDLRARASQVELQPSKVKGA